MLKSKRLKDTIAVGLLALFAAAAVWAENDILSGRDLLKAIREKEGRGPKPAYEEREAQSEKPIVSDTNEAKQVAKPEKTELVEVEPAKPVVSEVRPKPLAESESDELLAMVPADSLFCVRVNNLDYTLNRIDAFLAGASPIPLGASAMARMQLAKLLGSPELSGLKTTGDFAVFGSIPGTDPSESGNFGILVPVTDYKQFVSGNDNVGQPDAQGISKITSEGTPLILVTQVGNYVLAAENHRKLMAMAKSISTAGKRGLDSILDADEVKLATKERIWAYVNLEQASKTFGPLVSGQLEQMKTMMEAAGPSGQIPGASPADAMKMYAGIAEALMKSTRSLSLTVRPEPSVCNLAVSVSAVPGTDMASMLVADASAEQENKLLTYLEDGAMMNFASKTNTPFWKKLNLKAVDLFTAMMGESMPAEDMAKMKALVTDSLDSLGEAMVFSFGIDPESKPPFAIKYALDIKDIDKYNKVLKQATEMMNTGGIADFYKKMGMETSFTIKQGVDTYKGVSIDSAELVMKSTEPDSPQAQMIEQMYGQGLKYRWATTDGLFVGAAGGDVDSAVRKLIDQAKAGGPKPMATEVKSALTLIPEASKADFLATFNFLRIFPMIGAFAPVPIPQMDIPTKSNIVFAGRIGGGKATLEIALPKEHMTEIMGAVLMMQQKMMEQMEEGTTMEETMIQPEASEEYDFGPSGTITQEGVLLAKVRNVTFPEMYGKQGDEYKLPLIVRLPNPVLDVSGGMVQNVVTGAGASLLPEREWDREIHFPRLGNDKKTIEIDVEIRNPNTANELLKEISGTLEYFTAGGTRKVDSGIIDFAAEAKIEEVGGVIQSIQQDQSDTDIQLDMGLPHQAVRSAEFYSQDGRRLSVTMSGWSGKSTVIFTARGKLPPKGRIVLEVAQDLERHEIGFKLENVRLEDPFKGKAKGSARETGFPP